MYRILTALFGAIIIFSPFSVLRYFLPYYIMSRTHTNPAHVDILVQPSRHTSTSLSNFVSFTACAKSQKDADNIQHVYDKITAKNSFHTCQIPPTLTSLNILPRFRGVTIDGVWIRDSDNLYTHTTRDYTLQSLLVVAG
jgi:hypothetical protein